MSSKSSPKVSNLQFTTPGRDGVVADENQLTKALLMEAKEIEHDVDEEDKKKTKSFQTRKKSSSSKPKKSIVTAPSCNDPKL
jgi:hypothetical protein